ncbi:uncharacterized protein LOC110065842 isoform X2 [Orbicella faveolata]|uniref:uncharacterized protein LOC110065842 isoform X2 n=1 Tax=Orbicella faveolata TaxID=48498 RepID=UPI0009E635B9|nr:uncharacterized protein LOC110065842 isoform X2 [Orbicella faveolata]
MIRRELSFVRAAFFVFLMFDLTSQVEAHAEAGDMTTSQSVSQYPWKLPSARYGIANHPDSVQAVEGFDAFPGHGNTPYKSAQSSAEYPWLRTYGTKRESISQGDQRKSYITTDKAGGVRDPLTKRNQIRKATRRYQRK